MWQIPPKHLYVPIGPLCVNSQKAIILIYYWLRFVLDIKPPAADGADYTLYFGVGEVVAALRRTDSPALNFV
jgi:hypothetical protein